MLIVVVMGGIYSGKFTPTEAAAMSAVYACFIAVFVYKDLKLSQIRKVLLDSASLSAMLLLRTASRRCRVTSVTSSCGRRPPTP